MQLNTKMQALSLQSYDLIWKDFLTQVFHFHLALECVSRSERC